MKLSKIEQYYNKFNEDKRLLSRHGQVEFFVTSKYIKQFAKTFNDPKIADIGAGTGRYSALLSGLGYETVAVELVKKNVRVIEQRCPAVKVFQGDARNLKMLPDCAFDVVLLLGPMYHLFTFSDKLKALEEAKRIATPNGLIFVAYCMNDYAVLTYAFKEGNLQAVLSNGKLDQNFQTQTNEEDLYSYDSLEKIDQLQRESGLERVKIFSPDGPTDYIRSTINKLSEKDFSTYQKYVESIAERADLLGAGSHIVDVLKKV
jgi:SAM-dependent methyltransferase